jgi:hypothetical protein
MRSKAKKKKTKKKKKKKKEKKDFFFNSTHVYEVALFKAIHQDGRQ